MRDSDTLQFYVARITCFYLITLEILIISIIKIMVKDDFLSHEFNIIHSTFCRLGNVRWIMKCAVDYEICGGL